MQRKHRSAWKWCRVSFLAALLVNLSYFGSAQSLESVYDPLQQDHEPQEPIDLLVQDDLRARDLPIRVYLPPQSPAAPVVLFSHGLGGSREGSPYLGRHWSARGYVVVYVQHPGSDDAIWRDLRLIDRRRAMQEAANLKNVRLRVGDIPVVLDQLQEWTQSDAHPLYARLDIQRVGMSGHSFGAVTTQLVSGQSHKDGPSTADPRIQAAVMMSPSVPRWAEDPQSVFASVDRPWMLLTGTRDDVPLLRLEAISRLEVFAALPPGDKYQLVLHEAQHSAFLDRRLPSDRLPRNPNHHRAIVAITTAFWDAYLWDDPQAREWLQTDAVQNVLQAKDDWQTK